MSNFGATFRKAREESGLTLDKIAAETRISSRFLTAIENEDFHLLPGGVFNRGFIRSYAERIGLDQDQALADYDRLSVAVEEPAEGLRNVERESTRRTERNLYPIAAGILLVLIAGFYVMNRNAGEGSGDEPDSPAALEQTAAPINNPTAPVNSTAVPVEVTAAPDPLPLAAAPSVSAPAPATPAPAAGPATLVLDVDIKDVSWVKITADGNVLLSDNLSPGDTRRFTAVSSITVSLGNAGGTGLKINGREIAPLGQAGQVRVLTITPENAAKIR